MFGKKDRTLLKFVHDQISLWSGRIERADKNIAVGERQLAALKQREADDRTMWLADRAENMRHTAEVKAKNALSHERNEKVIARCEKLNDEFEKLMGEMRVFMQKRKA